MNPVKKLKVLLSSVRVENSRTLSIIQVLVAALFLAGVALMCYVFVRNEWTSAVGHVIAGGESLTDLAAGACEEPLARKDTLSLNSVVAKLKYEDRLAFAQVSDADGAVLARFGNAALAERLAAMSPADSWETPHTVHRTYRDAGSGMRYYTFERPVLRGDEHLGAVRVALRHPPLLPFIASGMRRAGMGLFGVALLLMLGNYFLHACIGPLGRLKRQVLDAQDKEWEKLDLDLPSGGEAGEIAAGIDRIISNLSVRYRTLADSNRELQVSNRVILFEKRRTESIIDGLSDGVLVTDAYGRISLANREAETLMQIDRKEVLGRLPAEALPSRKEIMQFIGTDGAATRRRSAEFDFSNGEGRKIVRAVWSPFTTTAAFGGAGAAAAQGDKPAGGMLLLREVTQQKMEEQARRDFISNVVHELRAPLSSIKSYVEMLIDNEADTPELRTEFFNTINEEADRLARLIDNMLSISKIEIGGLVLNKSSVKTRKLLEDAISSVAGTAKSKNIKLSANLPDDLPEAELDKEMVRMVLMNLLGNAIKYTEPGGSVIVAGEVDAAEMKVHVIDTGWGIPPDEQEKVFQKFYRGRRTAKDKVMGNGLGLALAKEIACLHGGDVHLQSEEGKGSKFTLSLPLR